MKLVNLTPHSMRITTDEGSIVEVPASGVIARVKLARWVVGELDVEGSGIALCTATRLAAFDLAPPEEGTAFIVSRLVADSAPERTDLLVPDDMLRDESGRTNGFRVFSTNATPQPPADLVARAKIELAALLAMLEAPEPELEQLAGRSAEHLDAAERSLRELAERVIDAALAPHARAAGLDGAAAARRMIAEHPGFQEVRDRLGNEVLTHPAFVRWLVSPDVTKSPFVRIARGEAIIAFRNNRLVVEAAGGT
jgi:hypothetical protein